jgi:DNA-directed RNA polymerase specialized sigma24 family protein
MMEPIDRSERLLALLLLQSMKGSSQREKVTQLSVAGFSNTEIADLLQTTAAVVAQSLYTTRRTRRPGK